MSVVRRFLSACSAGTLPRIHRHFDLRARELPGERALDRDEGLESIQKWTTANWWSAR